MIILEARPYRGHARNGWKERVEMQQKPLKDYTNEELLQILEENEVYHHSALAFICSEILRRFITLDKLEAEERIRSLLKRRIVLIGQKENE
jgi:hypothetical protein